MAKRKEYTAKMYVEDQNGNIESFDDMTQEQKEEIGQKLYLQVVRNMANKMGLDVVVK